MSYQSQNQLVTDELFLTRVRQAICKIALDIQSESVATTYHASRGAWALYCLKNATMAARTMVAAIVCDDTTTDASTDANLNDRVSAIWNAFAVVTS